MESPDAADLIESAMSDVRVIDCPMCGGRGRIEKALDVECPRCNGTGKTTSSGTPLTRWDEHGPN